MKSAAETFLRVVLFCTLAFLTGCGKATAHVSYQPPALPLSVSVDSNGQIEFGAEVSIPTPLGTFSVGVVTDPSEYFNVQNALTVRFDGQDHIYDLHGADFSVSYEEGYYKKIQVTKTGSNILLEISHSEQETNTYSESSQTSSYSDCSKAYGGRLHAGDHAKVVVFQVTFRDRPGGPGYGSKLNVLARDKPLEILEGSTCVNEMYFVRAHSDIVGDGWIAEGDQENYYLQPAN